MAHFASGYGRPVNAHPEATVVTKVRMIIQGSGSFRTIATNSVRIWATDTSHAKFQNVGAFKPDQTTGESCRYCQLTPPQGRGEGDTNWRLRPAFIVIG